MTSSEYGRTFTVGDECVVVIETTSGDIQVHGWDREEVAVPDPEDDVRIFRDGNGLTVRASAGGSADLLVRVPHHCDLTVRTASGDLDVRDIAGRVSVQTMSGDLQARGLRGMVRVSSVSGDVILSHSRLLGLSADTVSGDLVIEASLDAEGDYHVRSVSGDLVLAIPEAQGLNILSSTLSGGFHSDLPHEVDRRGWGKLEARVNGGGPLLRVHTASGDIRVRPVRHEGAAPQQEAPPEESPFAAYARSTRPLGHDLVEEAVAEEHSEEQPPETEPFTLDPEESDADENLSPAARRMAILRAIEEGRLTVAEGLARLRALD